MDSSPFAAKLVKVVQEIGLDLFWLRQAKLDAVQQPNLPQVAEQFKLRVLAVADHMDMLRTAIVWISPRASPLNAGSTVGMG